MHDPDGEVQQRILAALQFGVDLPAGVATSPEAAPGSSTSATTLRPSSRTVPQDSQKPKAVRAMPSLIQKAPATESIRRALYGACADGESGRVRTLLEDFDLKVQHVRLPLLAAANGGFVSILWLILGVFQESKVKVLDLELRIDVALAAARQRRLDLLNIALNGLLEEDREAFAEKVLVACVEHERSLEHLLHQKITPSSSMLASLLNAAAARGTPDTLVLLLSHAGYDFLPASLSSADSTSDPSSPSPNHNSSSSPPSPSRPKLPIIAGLYPLHAAAGARRPSLDTLPMMNYLIHDLDLDVNALDDMKLDRYITGTPLHHAVQWDHLERVELLLEEGADPRIENQFYETPLKISVIRGQSAVIRGLLQDAIVVWEGRESQGEK